MAEIYNLLSKEKSDKQKSLLGAYDTINDNIITRQTGYITLNGSENYHGVGNGCIQLDDYIFPTHTGLEGANYPCKSNYSIEWVWSGIKGILIQDNHLIINAGNVNYSLEEVMAYISNNPIIIHYKLATSYTEINLGYSEYNLYHNELLKVAKEQLQLFDINQGYITDNAMGANGDPYASMGNFATNYVPLKPNTTYSKNNALWVNYYDSSKNFISQTVGNTFLTPSNCYYARFTGNLVDVNLFMLNEGTKPMPYQPYKGDILHTSDLKDINGTNGKSAYEIAVENGFTGTEQAWLNSLKGANGTIDSVLSIVNGNWYIDGVDTGVAARGPSGINGANGTDGTNGVNGSGTKIFYGVFQINSGTTCTFEVEVGDTIFITILDEQTQTTYTVTLNITDDFMNGISMINAQVGSYTITFSMSGGLLVIDSINPDTDQLYIISAIGF